MIAPFRRNGAAVSLQSTKCHPATCPPRFSETGLNGDHLDATFGSDRPADGVCLFRRLDVRQRRRRQLRPRHPQRQDRRRHRQPVVPRRRGRPRRPDRRRRPRPAGTGKREIDASGLVVAPGFIDMHSHSDFLLLEDGNAQSKIRQGVTTEVLGEGSSAGPVPGQARRRRRSTVSGKQSTLDDARRLLRRRRQGRRRRSTSPPTSASTTSGKCVMGKSHARPTPAQLEQMKALVDEAMKDGALRPVDAC